MSDNSSPLPMFVKEAFIAGTLAALQELYQLEGIADPESDSADSPISLVHAIVAQIKLLLEPPGILIVAAPVDVASRLAQRYLPEGSHISDDLIDDCIGELANVIAGQAKTALKGTPYHFMLTTPVVARHTARPNESTRAWRCTIASEAGVLAIIVQLP